MIMHECHVYYGNELNAKKEKKEENANNLL
jgi:hypothetical protein